MILLETVDLSSYYPGYDDYCEPREEKEDIDDLTVDEIVDDLKLEKEESE